MNMKELFNIQAEEMKNFLRAYNFKPNDLLGQNFLTDENALREIMGAAEIKPGDEVMEIGSGIGNLTELLAEKAEFVLAIEKDKRYFPILKDRLKEKLQAHSKTPKASANVHLEFADAMTFNYQKYLKPGYKVVANIPYYITGKIIEMLLVAKNKPSKIILLVQKEVAQRVVAPAGNMSILSISVQLYTKPKFIATVPKESFYPQPKVDSAILSMDVLPRPVIDVDEKTFFSLVKAAFAGKRKQIHNSLKNNLRISDDEVQKILKTAEVDPKARPQELSFRDWDKIYNAIFAKKF